MVQHKDTSNRYDIRWDTTVHDLKNRVADKEHLPLDLVELAYEGTCLPDHSTLIEAGIFDNDGTPLLMLLDR